MNLFTGVAFSELLATQRWVKPDPSREYGGLTEANVTLAEQLEAQGVHTRAVSANPFVNTKLGFAQGFSSFHDIYEWDPAFRREVIRKYRAGEVNEVAFRYLRELQASGKPWFLYLHYFDPHMPYRAPAADRGRFRRRGYDRVGRVVGGMLRRPDGKQLRYLTPNFHWWIDDSDIAAIVAEYDAEIHHLDRGLRRLYEFLEEIGALRTTDLIITADHGEAFMERDFWGHGYSFSRSEEQHVPLIVVSPASGGAKHQSSTEPVTTTDIYYSILAHFGMPVEEEAGAVSWILDVFTHRKQGEVAYTEGLGGTRIFRNQRHALYRYGATAELKFPVPIPNSDFLFDLDENPEETIDLFAGDPTSSTVIKSRLLNGAGAVPSFAHSVPADPIEDTSGPTRERLRALGYIR